MMPVLSGLLAGLSFPALLKISFSWGPLAWFALVPVYLRLFSGNRKGRAVFWEGWITGLCLYGVSLYWVFIAMHVYGGVSTGVSLAGLFLLIAVLAFFLAGSFWAAHFFRQWGVPAAVAFPACWVLQDWVRNFFPFGGFSWSSLAYSQGGFLSLIQIADLTGPYGVTFLILLTNVLFGEVVLFLRKKRKVPAPPALPVRLGIVTVFLVGGALLYGPLRSRQVQTYFQKQPETKLALIQGNIPQEEKWLEEETLQLIQMHLSLSEKAQKEYRPDLILWPEAAYAAAIPPDIVRIGLVDRLRTPLLFGAVSYEGEIPEEWPPPTLSEFVLHNSAFLIEPGGFIAGQYDKNHLVPLGEYVPLKKVFFFVNKLVPGFTDFSPGKRFNLLETGPLKLGVTICFEDLFPEIARRFVRQGANLLVNLTNDAWYEKSSAILQHVEFSRFRAIENRRYLARATNTGVTTVFDPTGREVARAALFEEATLPATLKLGGPTTFYTRFGDLFVLGLGLILFAPFLKRRRCRNGLTP